VAARLEAMLFAAAEPVPLARLAAAAGVTEAQARRALAELAAHLDAHGHGVALAELAGGLQLLTRPEHAEAVASLAAPRQPPLSRAALETLAIVAFRQPVTRAAIEELRGVHSEGAIASLLERGLIAEGGRAEAPGRPILYVTTRRFLEHFGLRSLDELKALDGVLPPEGGRGEAGPRPRRLPVGENGADPSRH
jgi:segregation and condensation protein B